MRRPAYDSERCPCRGGVAAPGPGVLECSQPPPPSSVSRQRLEAQALRAVGCDGYERPSGGCSEGGRGGLGWEPGRERRRGPWGRGPPDVVVSLPPQVWKAF